MGDYAFPCFRLAKTLRKAPALIAQEIAAAYPVDEIVTEASAVGGYVNFRIDRAFWAKQTLTRILTEREKYGSSDEGRGKTVCIDYSSVNIAKPFHIGHLSTTVLGSALYKLHKFLGYTPVGINHLGDYGTQFGKLISAYKRWGSRAVIEQGGLRALNALYVRFHEEAEKDPSLNDEARAFFKKIEEKDPESVALFEWFKELTLKDVGRIYDMLDVHFDSWAGESFYNDKMEPVVDELREKGLLVESEGAQIVDLSAYDMPPCIILRSDGASLYATRDIAAAVYRKNTYDFYKCLYVVAYQQNLHFRQFFKVLELMGKEWAKDLVHVAYGMVSLEDGSMSTRKGRVVYLEDVIHKCIEKASAVIAEKNPDLENREEVAKTVGVGAVIFGALYNNKIKDITFSYDKVLNFEGETSCYVQYTCARAHSVLEKAGGYAAPDGTRRLPAGVRAGQAPRRLPRDAARRAGKVRALLHRPLCGRSGAGVQQVLLRLLHFERGGRGHARLPPRADGGDADHAEKRARPARHRRAGEDVKYSRGSLGRLLPARSCDC